eukprot:546168_1
MEFDFYFNGRSNIPHPLLQENFFRIGHKGVDGGCDEGSRYPSMWLTSGTNASGLFDISVSGGTQCDLSHVITAYGNIPIGRWMRIIITIDWTTISFVLSDQNGNYSETWQRPMITNKNHLGSDLPVWFMSDKPAGSGYNIGDARFRNISITSTIFTYAPTSVTLPPSIHTSEPTTVTPNSTISPTFVPSATPTAYPTNYPTSSPTNVPTLGPTLNPTLIPTFVPSATPTAYPTNYPTSSPTNVPTLGPTLNPTLIPTFVPTFNPTLIPTVHPTITPTMNPTIEPTYEPTIDPTIYPTL